MVECVDVLQVGVRNMQNFVLLKALAQQPRPVLLKRGPAATLTEWLMAAEYPVDRSTLTCGYAVFIHIIPAYSRNARRRALSTPTTLAISRRSS
jgi:hypothetical protein